MMDFDDFARANYASVLRTVALALGDHDVARDATQEAFAKALLRWRRVAAMDRPAGWVAIVATNAGRRMRRRRKSDPRSVRVAVEARDGEVVDALTFRGRLEALPPRQRAVVVLRFLADLSVADTARALGVAPGTVKAATHAALGKLRAELEAEDMV